MTARILPFARKPLADAAIEASGSEPGTAAGESPLSPSFLHGATLVHDARAECVAHIIRPRNTAGVYRKPFGCGVWVYHPDGDAMPTACVTVPETRETLDAFLRSRLTHPSNTTKGIS